MDSIEKRTELIVLYDIYGQLLTEKQRQYFEDYFDMDLSLAEIAEQYNVSRNAVHDMLKKTEELLTYYESSLHIHQKNEKILNCLKNDIKYEEIKQIIEE